MKATIQIMTGLITTVLLIVGILITAWKYLSDFNGVAVAVSIIILLLGLYIIALLLKKQKMIWIVISALVVLWIVGFLMGVLDIGSGFFSNTQLFAITVVNGLSYVYEKFFGYSKFTGLLNSLIGSFCSFILITTLLCIGALGLKQPKMANNKSGEKISTETKET